MGRLGLGGRAMGCCRGIRQSAGLLVLVISTLSSVRGQDDEWESVPANYQYEYAVKDPDIKLDFSARESRVVDDTTGTYQVLLPDGRVQTVSYVVSGPDGGYVVDVVYDGEAQYAPVQPKSASSKAVYKAQKPAAYAPAPATGYDQPAPAYSEPAPAPATGYNEPAPATGYNEPAPAPAYNEPAPATGYSESAPDTGYNEPAIAPAYNEPATAPAYNEPAPATGYNEPAPAPATGYNEPVPATGYNKPAPATGYNEPAPAYNEPAPAPTYNGPAPAPTYNEPAPTIGYNVPAPAPVIATGYNEPALVATEYQQPAQVYTYTQPNSNAAYEAPFTTFTTSAQDYSLPSQGYVLADPAYNTIGSYNSASGTYYTPNSGYVEQYEVNPGYGQAYGNPPSYAASSPYSQNSNLLYTYNPEYAYIQEARVKKSLQAASVLNELISKSKKLITDNDAKKGKTLDENLITSTEEEGNEDKPESLTTGTDSNTEEPVQTTTLISTTPESTASTSSKLPTISSLIPTPKSPEPTSPLLSSVDLPEDHTTSIQIFSSTITSFPTPVPLLSSFPVKVSSAEATLSTDVPIISSAKPTAAPLVRLPTLKVPTQQFRTSLLGVSAVPRPKLPGKKAFSASERDTNPSFRGKAVKHEKIKQRPSFQSGLEFRRTKQNVPRFPRGFKGNPRPPPKFAKSGGRNHPSIPNSPKRPKRFHFKAPNFKIKKPQVHYGPWTPI